MRVILSVIISPLIAVGGWFLYAAKPGQVKMGIALMVLTLVFGSVQSVTSALFTARHRNDVPALLGVINKAAYLVCILAAGALGLGYYGFIYAAICTAFLSALLGAIWAAKHIRLRPMFHIDHWKYMMRTSIPLGIIQIINMLYYKIDSVMLSVMRSPKEVGLYMIAYGIIDVVMSVPSMFMTSLMPSLATADKETLRRLVNRAFDILAFFALPIAVGGMLLAHEIVLLISSNEFVGAAVPFAILMIGAAFSYLNSVFGFASVAVNKQSRLLKISIMTIILNVLINLVAIPHYGVAGAATATLITEIIACIGVYLVFRSQTGISVHFTLIWKMAVAALAMIPVKLAVDRLHLPFFAHFLTVGAGIAAVYFVTVALFRGIPTDLQPILQRLIPRK